MAKVPPTKPGVILMTVDGDEIATVDAAAIGTPADEPWNGTDPEASMISLLKKIALNTAP